MMGLPRKRNDELLKGILEDNFKDMLCFLYPSADTLFDFSRGFTFMDKELIPIFPERIAVSGSRIVDLLVKTYLNSGAEKWILVHVEIEGASKEAFLARLFTYHYRLLDRFHVPVETIVLYTTDKRQKVKREYHYQVIKTEIRFRFLGYHIFDHSKEALLSMDNIFALVVLACQQALNEGKLWEEELALHRLTIARSLLKNGKYGKDRILRFLYFLKNFIFIQNDNLNQVFDDYIGEVSGGTIKMGVIEVVKKHAREDGLAKGLENERKRIREIAKKLKGLGVSNALIAKATNLPIHEIDAL